jgi:UDP-GlcNAc:undecaprenyl-phosphate GlcNAc-1-phosphate transferase
MENKYYFNFIFLLFSLFSYFFVYFKRKKISENLNVFDYPNSKRKIHSIPVPKTASYPLFFTFLLILITNLFFKIYTEDLNVILIGTICIFFIGFLDDKYDLSPYHKILFKILVIFFVTSLSNNLIITKIYFQSYDTFLHLNLFSFFVTCIAVLLLTNAVNLSDGINGLTIGIIFFWLFFFLIKKNSSDLNFIIYIVLINLFIAFFHTYNTKHFLGDSGSLMLSAFISFSVILETNMSINKELLVISAEHLLILFWLPGIDMLRVFTERIIRNKSPFKADQEHLHHYLFKKYSLKKSLFIYYTTLIIPVILTWHLKFNSILVLFIMLFFYFLFVSYLKLNLKVIK